MTQMKTPLKVWISAIEDTAHEFAATTLAQQECTLQEHSERLPEKIYGAFISLSNENLEAIIGVLGDPADCGRLAKAFLGMEENETLSDNEVADTIGELANILAGGIKAGVAGENPGLRINMPYFVNGAIQFQEPYKVSSMQALWREMKITLLLVLREARERGAAC